MTEINKNNLPVLYTVPKWKMYKTYGKKGLSYFIPELNRYITKASFRKELASLGMSDQDWYDRWILNITSSLDRPKCRFIGCNEYATFLGPSPSRGYRMSCNNKIHVSAVQSMNMSESSKRYHKLNPEYGRERGKILSNRYKENPEWSENARIRGINRYNDPEERRKTSELTKAALNAPGMHEKLSSSQSLSYKINPERREKISKAGIKRYENESERKRQSNIAKEISLRPGVNELRSHTWKKNSIKGGYIETIKSNSLKMWMNPSEARLNAHKGYGKKSQIYSNWENKMIKFDSSWEEHFFNRCTELDIDKLLRCPFGIRYVSTDNEIHTYLPDFLLNDKYLIEIKPNYLIHDPVNQAKFHAASIYCHDHGLSYVIITEDYLFKGKKPYHGSLPFHISTQLYV